MFLVLLNWQAVESSVVDHSQSVHVALRASSTSLEEQFSESLVDVGRQEPRGCRVWGSSQMKWGKCDNFLVFTWLTGSKKSYGERLVRGRVFFRKRVGRLVGIIMICAECDCFLQRSNPFLNGS